MTGVQTCALPILSLQALVFDYGFWQFHLREIGDLYMFVQDTDLNGRDLSKIEEVFDGFGFKKHRFYDKWINYYETNHSALAYLRPTGVGAQFLLSTNDQKLCDQFTEKVKVELDMRRVGRIN